MSFFHRYTVCFCDQLLLPGSAFFFFQAEDGIRVLYVTGVQTCALPFWAYHTCALLANGTLRCWGRNGQGQIGDGTFVSSTTPVPVDGVTGAGAVSGGGGHTCAVLSGGTVQCWGENTFGQLGDGTTTSSSTPVRVRGITGAVAVTAGWWHHSCALLGNGT